MGVVAPIAESVPPADADRRRDLVTPDGLYRHEFRAMGTTVSVLVPEEHRLAAASVALLFESWEATFSRFRPSSELSRLNARAGRRVAVSPLMLEVVERALDAARATDGLFDPTLERPLRALGYDRTFDALPADRPLPRRTASVAGRDRASRPGGPGGWREIELDREATTIRLPRGAGLDLGGIAKGLAVDAALAGLAGFGALPCAVEAGGDLAVAGLPPGGAAWPLRIELPDGGADVVLPAGAVATSGISRRAWRVGGETRHHLLDPRTGGPARTGLWSSTAFAATCGQAEVAAKVAFLLGESKAVPFLVGLGVPALLVRADGSQVAVGGWGASGPPSAQGLSAAGAARAGSRAASGPAAAPRGQR